MPEVVNSLLLTYNCGKKPPLSDQFFERFSLELPIEPPKLIAIGFQEISSIFDGTVPRKIVNILNYFAKLLNKELVKKYQSHWIELVSVHNFGNVGLVCFTIFNGADEPANNDKAIVEKAMGIPVGQFCTGLKGGIAVKVKFPNVMSIIIIVAHINAGESLYSLKRRVQDLENILTGLKFNDGSSVSQEKDVVLMMGDLNFRASGLILDGNNSANEIGHLKGKIQKIEMDEFGKVLKVLPLLKHFKEADIKFGPSYKYAHGIILNSARIPSWCDRIIFKGNVDVKRYDTIVMGGSDHLPVVLEATIRGPLLSAESSPNVYGNDSWWKLMRAVAYFMDSIIWIALGSFSKKAISVYMVLIIIYCVW